MVPYGNASTGKKLSLSGFSGKVAVLSFFTWDCKNCMKEMPILASLYEKYREKGMELVFLHVGIEGLGSLGSDYKFGMKFSSKKIEAMFADVKDSVDWKKAAYYLDWNILEKSPYVYHKFATDFKAKRVVATPHLVIIDANGNNVYDHAGWFDRDDTGKKEIEHALVSALESIK